jgi:hypothetical protein
LDGRALGDIFTTFDDREGDAVSLISTVQVRDSLSLHGRWILADGRDPVNSKGAQPPRVVIPAR